MAWLIPQQISIQRHCKRMHNVRVFMRVMRKIEHRKGRSKPGRVCHRRGGWNRGPAGQDGFVPPICTGAADGIVLMHLHSLCCILTAFQCQCLAFQFRFRGFVSISVFCLVNQRYIPVLPLTVFAMGPPRHQRAFIIFSIVFRLLQVQGRQVRRSLHGNRRQDGSGVVSLKSRTSSFHPGSDASSSTKRICIYKLSYFLLSQQYLIPILRQMRSPGLHLSLGASTLLLRSQASPSRISVGKPFSSNVRFRRKSNALSACTHWQKIRMPSAFILRAMSSVQLILRLPGRSCCHATIRRPCFHKVFGDPCAQRES